MTVFWQILGFTLPSLVVFFTALFMLKKFFDHEQKKMKLQIAMDNEQLIDPIRLQAYERLVLFLERINPESMILRLSKSGMTSHELRSEIHSTIRMEFEHNLAQQIYVSHEAWEVIKSAKGNLTKLVNQCGDRVNPKGPAMDLARCILETIMGMNKPPVQIAIDFLKQELKELYF